MMGRKIVVRSSPPPKISWMSSLSHKTTDCVSPATPSAPPNEQKYNMVMLLVFFIIAYINSNMKTFNLEV